MAKPITIPNTFASATSAIPLSQLDQDFSTLANATNDLATYSNYVADTGAADAYIANFPANTLSADVYELTMFSPPSSGNVYWSVTRLNTGHKAEGTYTAGLPSSSTLLCHNNWRTNNATALAVGIDLCGLYMETDY